MVRVSVGYRKEGNKVSWIEEIKERESVMLAPGLDIEIMWLRLESKCRRVN
jgi:hypothetical protein